MTNGDGRYFIEQEGGKEREGERTREKEQWKETEQGT